MVPFGLSLTFHEIVWSSEKTFSGIYNRHHHVHLVAVIDVGIGHNVVITLGVDVDLIVVVIIVVEVIVDVGDNAQDVHGCGQEGHLGYINCGCVSCSWAPSVRRMFKN